MTLTTILLAVVIVLTVAFLLLRMSNGSDADSNEKVVHVRRKDRNREDPAAE